MSKKKQPTGDYPVGYCKPPDDHKFKPGDRANPNGRPPKSANDNIDFVAIIRRVGLKSRSVTVDGRKRKTSYVELGLEQMLLKYANGSARSYKEFVALLKEFFPRPAEEDDGVDYGAELRAKLAKMARGTRQEGERRAALEEERAHQAKKDGG